MKPSQQWITDCKNWYGKVLNGAYAHWCNEWDGLPIDWTRGEFTSCQCYSSPLFKLLRSLRSFLDARWLEKSEQRCRERQVSDVQADLIRHILNKESNTKPPGAEAKLVTVPVPRGLAPINPWVASDSPFFTVVHLFGSDLKREDRVSDRQADLIRYIYNSQEPVSVYRAA